MANSPDALRPNDLVWLRRVRDRMRNGLPFRAEIDVVGYIAFKPSARVNAR